MSRVFSSFTGQTMTVSLGNGLTAKAEAFSDYDMGTPWEEEDGHGPVEEARENYTGHIAKRAGQRVLWSDRGRGLLYDMKAATEQAKREGWGISGDTAGMTRGQEIAEAVERDFQRMRGYAEGDWWWTYVQVSVLDPEGEELVRETLGGIASDAGEYYGEVAGELLEQAISYLPDAIASAALSHEKTASRLRNIAIERGE